MEKDESLSLQLLAYADGDEANASKARRLSLSRALEVRKYLMELGVRSTRIEVRALGNKVEGGGPADRVDAMFASR
jgi:outer membrane protein OmpA-like peptidoglycan-associated protein